MENNKYLTVTALNRYLAYKFDNDRALQNIMIKGEISNFRIAGGHLYFSLKDETSEIRAVMFARAARGLIFMPADGMTVIIRAKVAVYQKGGTYNLNVFSMEDAGLGDIYLNFLRLKERLKQEGLFDEARKLKVPVSPRNIGVITSSTADALQDILSTINKRYPFVKVYLYPALVQGKEAPGSIIRALTKANRDALADVVIIARGGGSFEDLSCFNNETLARAIVNSKIPTVTGIGHETDFTIADYVASHRAPTPTGAAVFITKDRNILAREINEKINMIKYYYKRILEKKYYEYQNIITKHHFKNFSEAIKHRENELERLIYNLKVHSPLALVEKNLNRIDEMKTRLKTYNLPQQITEKIKYVDKITDRLHYCFRLTVDNREKEHMFFLEKLNILNPMSLMKKGYTLTFQEGNIITSHQDIAYDKHLTVRFHDGALTAQPIKSKNEE